jgi:glycosyltransferase involved in cell wall biosynthesis
MSTPLLILSDSVSTNSGLARIARELATRIHQHLPEFRVATCGLGGGYTASVPFPNYPVSIRPGHNPTVVEDLPQIWADFTDSPATNSCAAGSRATAGSHTGGILLAIWNSSWLEWLANPYTLPEGKLKDFLIADPFERWAYLPQDGHCANLLLPESQAKIVASFDRVLGYNHYGADLMTRSVAPYPNHKQQRPFPHLPHGTDTSVFYPRDRAEARRYFPTRVANSPIDLPIREGAFMLGVNATNTPRKDWHLAFEVAAELKMRGRNVGIWAHTNTSRAYWDISDLARIFQLSDRMMLTTHQLTDEQLAWGYSAMDCVLGIASGGGWELVHSEALACGTPVVHGNYAGGAEFLPKEFLVEPKIYRGEGAFSMQRPHFAASDWADAVERAVEMRQLAKLPSYISWDEAWPQWVEWLLRGVEGV